MVIAVELVVNIVSASELQIDNVVVRIASKLVREIPIRVQPHQGPLHADDLPATVVGRSRKCSAFCLGAKVSTDGAGNIEIPLAENSRSAAFIARPQACMPRFLARCHSQKSIVAAAPACRTDPSFTAAKYPALVAGARPTSDAVISITMPCYSHCVLAMSKYATFVLSSPCPTNHADVVLATALYTRTSSTVAIDAASITCGTLTFDAILASANAAQSRTRTIIHCEQYWLRMIPFQQGGNAN